MPTKEKTKGEKRVWQDLQQTQLTSTEAQVVTVLTISS
jgi:hypothetical protein